MLIMQGSTINQLHAFHDRQQLLSKLKRTHLLFLPLLCAACTFFGRPLDVPIIPKVNLKRRRAYGLKKWFHQVAGPSIAHSASQHKRLAIDAARKIEMGSKLLVAASIVLVWISALF